MSEHAQHSTLPKRMWLKGSECEVEVIGTGHFPTTVMVYLPDNRKIEVEDYDLMELKDGATTN